MIICNCRDCHHGAINHQYSSMFHTFSALMCGFSRVVAWVAAAMHLFYGSEDMTDRALTIKMKLSSELRVLHCNYSSQNSFHLFYENSVQTRFGLCIIDLAERKQLPQVRFLPRLFGSRGYRFTVSSGLSVRARDSHRHLGVNQTPLGSMAVLFCFARKFWSSHPKRGARVGKSRTKSELRKARETHGTSQPASQAGNRPKGGATT
jgi:hypothetical protein